MSDDNMRVRIALLTFAMAYCEKRTFDLFIQRCIVSETSFQLSVYVMNCPFYCSVNFSSENRLSTLFLIFFNCKKGLTKQSCIGPSFLVRFPEMGLGIPWETIVCKVGKMSDCWWNQEPINTLLTAATVSTTIYAY